MRSRTALYYRVSSEAHTDDVVSDGLTRIHLLAYGLITEVARQRIDHPALLDALCQLADEAETCQITHDERD